MNIRQHIHGNLSRKFLLSFCSVFFGLAYHVRAESVVFDFQEDSGVAECQDYYRAGILEKIPNCSVFSGVLDSNEISSSGIDIKFEGHAVNPYSVNTLDYFYNPLLDDYVYSNIGSGSINVTISGIGEYIEPGKQYSLYLFGRGRAENEGAIFDFNGMQAETSVVAAPGGHTYARFEFDSGEIPNDLLTFKWKAMNGTSIAILNGFAVVECLQENNNPPRNVFPETKAPEIVWIANTNYNDTDCLTDIISERTCYAVQTSLISAAGLAAKKGFDENIWIHKGDNETKLMTWTMQRRDVDSIKMQAPNNSWKLLKRFSSIHNNNYVLCDFDNSESVNVGKMAAFKYNAILCDISIEYEAINNGFTKSFDAIGVTEQWMAGVWLEDWPTKNIAVNNTPEWMWRIACNTDVATAWGGVCWTQPRNILNDTILRELDNNSKVFGFAPGFDLADSEYHEAQFIQDLSRKGHSCMVSDWFLNVVLCSSFKDKEKFPLKPFVDLPRKPPSANKHQAVLQWMDHDSGNTSAWSTWDSEMYQDDNRGKYNIGWNIWTANRDLIPIMAEYRLDTMTAKDQFCGHFTMGYSDSWYLNQNARLLDIGSTSDSMEDMGLEVLHIFVPNYPDNHQKTLDACWQDFMFYDNIRGVFRWGHNETFAGKIDFVNSKPVVSQTIEANHKRDEYLLSWQEAADVVNSKSVDNLSKDGYSYIRIQHRLDNAIQIADRLSDDVEIVKPNDFMHNLSVFCAPDPIDPYLWIDKGDACLTDWVSNEGVDVHPAFDDDGRKCTNLELMNNYGLCSMTLNPSLDITTYEYVKFDLKGNDSGGVQLQFHSYLGSLFTTPVIDLSSYSGWKTFTYYFTENKEGDYLYHYGDANRIQTAKTISKVTVVGACDVTSIADILIDELHLVKYGVRLNFEGNWNITNSCGGYLKTDSDNQTSVCSESPFDFSYKWHIYEKSDHNFYIQSLKNNLYLKYDPASGQAILSDIAIDDEYSLWKIVPTGRKKYYWLYNVKSGYYLCDPGRYDKQSSIVLKSVCNNVWIGGGNDGYGYISTSGGVNKGKNACYNVWENDQGLVALQSQVNDLFVSRLADGRFVSNSSEPVYQFSFEYQDSSLSAIKCVENNRYLCNEDCGNQDVYANRTVAGDWEMFNVEFIKSGRFPAAIRAVSNNMYVHTAGDGTASASAESMGKCDMFDFVEVQIGQYALRSRMNYNYIKLDEALNLVASVSLNKYEFEASRFKIERRAGGKFALLCLDNNEYVYLKNAGGRLAADGLSSNSLDEFYIEENPFGNKAILIDAEASFRIQWKLESPETNNLRSFSVLAACWMKDDSSVKEMDLNDDDVIDIQDLYILLRKWLQ